MAIRNNTFILKRSNVVGKIPVLSGLTLGELALNTADAKLYTLYTGGLTGATEVREIGWNRLSVSGGTLYGNLNVLGSVSATTFYGSGANLTNIPDTFVTGFTFSSNTLTILQNQGKTPLTASITTIDLSNVFSALTFNIGTTGSISATTFYGNGSNLTGIPDNFVTGGTYNQTTNTLTLNRQNGLVTVTGITDTFVTGFTYSNNNLTILRNQGLPNLTVNISTMTGLTIGGNLSATTINGQYLGTSGSCFTDLFVSNINSCSPLNIQPTNTGNVLIGSGGGVNVGIGLNSPTSKLHIVGADSSSSSFGLKIDTSASTINNFSVRNDGFIDASQYVGTVNPSNKKGGQLVVGRSILGDWLASSGYAYFGNALLDQTGTGSIYNYALLQYDNGTTAINSSTNTDVTIRENNVVYITFSNDITKADISLGNTNSSRKIDYYDDGTNLKIGVGVTTTNIQHYMTSGNSMTFNTGGNLQADGVNELMRIQGNDGNVGINNTNPQAKLDVGGKIKSTTLQVTSGATVGYVLTALDSNGNASWQPATGGGGGGNLSGDTYVTGFTYDNANTITLTQNNGQPPLSVNISVMTGLTVSGSVSATTYYGDGSNLTGLITTDYFVTGGTFSSNTLTLNRQNGSVIITGFTDSDNFVTGGTYNSTTNTLTLTRQNGSVTITGITDTFVTGFTYSSNNLTINQNQGRSPLSVNISVMTGLTINGNLTVTGNTVVRGITGTTALLSSSGPSVLTVIGSGSSTTLPIFSVQGSSGELFSVSDSLTGSLFSVNDISGLPILEVFSDNTILMGSYLAPSLNTTVRGTVNSGTTTIYSIPTSAYTGAFFDYTVNDGVNLRAGNIMSIWSGNTINYSETSTTDIGNTNPITFNMTVSSGFALLRTSATTNSWTVKTIVRSI